MTPYKWDSQHALQELERLIAPGVLGFYTHVEVTEVFTVPTGHTKPANMFSILVAEERFSAEAEEPVILNPNRIRPKSIKDWIFGVKRYVKPIAELVPTFRRLCESKEWSFSGLPLQVADLAPVPVQFVPPDSTGTVPLNRVLKNNFWNGSHVFEWADPTKALFQPIFNQPIILQQIADDIRPYVPIGLDGLSDRIGNILVQLPVTVLIAKFGQMRESGDFTVTVAWHERSQQRPLRATCEKEHDHTITDFMSADGQVSQTNLPMKGGEGLHRAVVWDDEYRVVLAASGELGFIESIALNMVPLGPYGPTRVFMVRGDDGAPKEIKVPLVQRPTPTIIGEPHKNPAGVWTERRIYREDAARLAREKRFVQYRPATGQQSAEHEKALNDLRLLMRQYGEEGAWLWDPYLTAHDVIETLLHCPHPNSDLRALTASYVPDSDENERDEVAAGWGCLAAFLPWRIRRTDPSSHAVSFAERQRAVLEGLTSNFLDLKLEFRMRTGGAGWAFHDRFLIFPITGRGALAWSLGTSVNSLGRQHHILQQADDGQLIMEAFLDLWSELDGADYQIWKKP